MAKLFAAILSCWEALGLGILSFYATFIDQPDAIILVRINIVLLVLVAAFNMHGFKAAMAGWQKALDGWKDAGDAMETFRKRLADDDDEHPSQRRIPG